MYRLGTTAGVLGGATVAATGGTPALMTVGGVIAAVALGVSVLALLRLRRTQPES